MNHKPATPLQINKNIYNETHQIFFLKYTVDTQFWYNF